MSKLGGLETPEDAQAVGGNQVATLCVVCEERPATGVYEGHDTCGRPSCDFQVQEFLDYNADVGAR